MSVDGALTMQLEGSAVNSVANNLTTTAEGYALDARQGKVLDDKKLDKSQVANNLVTEAEGYALDARRGKYLDEIKLDRSQVANNLTTEAEGYALDARQGKALKTLVDGKLAPGDVVNNLTSSETAKPLSAAQGKALKTLVDGKLAPGDVVNSLTSSETAKPLSAAQGKALKALVDAKASITAKSVNLTAAGWTGSSAPFTRTVTLGGVTADNVVIVSPAYAAQAEYYAAGVGASAQGAGTLTFTAQKKPSTAMLVNVLIIDG